MTGLDADRLDLGPNPDDVLGCGFAAAAAGFVAAVAAGLVVDSFAYAMSLWVALSLVLLVLGLRRCGTVLDTDGVHHRGLRRRTSLYWTELDEARWGEYPRRGDDDGTDVRLYTSSRRTGERLTVIAADGPGLAEPRSRWGRRTQRRFVAAVRALQGHGVPVVADTLALRSTMWALGLEPDVR